MDPAPVPRAPTSIGDLPDDVLIKIMSYLTSREAVHTCLLAKYWRDLWRSVPSVNVSIQEFDGQRRSNDVPMEELEGQDEGEDEDVQELEEEDGEDDDDMSVDDDNMSVEDDEDGEDDEDDEDDENDEDDEDEVVFKRFVNTLLKLRNPVDLNEFRLMYSVSSGTENRRNYRDANRWIAYALQCNAPSVKVANRVHALRLAPNVFSSRSLKRLHIGSAILPPGFFNQLQVGCPSLEYLFLHDCTIGDLEIFSSRLKILILSDEVYFPFDEGSQTCISAPSLISLNIDHGLSGDRLPVLTTMPSLKSASVSLSGGNIVTRDADSLRKFLGGLSHVTSLDFCYWDANLTMEKGFRWCPTFSKLINLTLDCSFVNGNFYGLIVILQNTPNLRRLTLNVGQSNTSVAGELEHESFTCGQLEIVEIICWGRDEMFNRVTMFLLEHGISDGKIHVTDRRNV